MYVLTAIINNADIPLEEVYKEVLEAEVRMNMGSRVRFHTTRIIESDIQTDKINLDADEYNKQT